MFYNDHVSECFNLKEKCQNNNFFRITENRENEIFQFFT